jgi:hypothetical protein
LRKGIKRKPLEEQEKLKTKWIPFCLVCLRTFTNDRPVVMMKCSHVICETCSSLTKDLTCPIHEEKFVPIGIQRLTSHILSIFQMIFFTIDTLIGQILQRDFLAIPILVSCRWMEEVFVELY